MDTQRIVEVVPHYIAMLVLVFLVLAGVQTLFGTVGFWIELLIVLAVVSAYRPVVQRLGVGPRAWERR